jgi:hypothetical protein
MRRPLPGRFVDAAIRWSVWTAASPSCCGLGDAPSRRRRSRRHGRPGGLFDHALRQRAPGTDGRAGPLQAHDLLVVLLDTLASVWTTGNTLDGLPLGDCWRHDAVPGPGASAGWVPFHKLSQWLCYSLLEPFAWAGHPVAGLELTGLPEYRTAVF